MNVYPDGMTGKERMDYIKRKANEYYALRAQWKDCIQKGMVSKGIGPDKRKWQPSLMQQIIILYSIVPIRKSENNNFTYY